MKLKISRRARIYVGIAAGWLLIIGLTILIKPGLFTGAAFVPLYEYTKLIGWGILYSAGGLVCLAAVLSRHRTLARLGMICSGIVALVSAFAVGWGVVETWIAFYGHGLGRPASPVFVIIMLAVALKDYLMVLQPLRTPFEDLVDEIEANPTGLL